MKNANIPKLFPVVEESVAVTYSEYPDVSSISLHSHNFIEFAYVLQGHGWEGINRDRFQVKPGYFSIIYPWQTHELHFDQNSPLKYYHVAISMDNFFGAGSVALELKDLFFRSGYSSASSYVFFEGDSQKRMDIAFQDMYREYVTRGKWWELAVKAQILDALILFDRQRDKLGDKVDVVANYSATQQTMDIVFYIYSNFKENLSLSLLSETFGLSQNYLSTIIKSSLGLTFTEFLHNLRLKYACTLLASTAMSVTDVAYGSGFQSYRNFARFFSDHYGMTPMAFRRMSEKHKP